MKLPREPGDLPFGDSLTASDGVLEDEGHYDGVLFSGLSIEGAHADLSRFMECAFADVTLDDVALRKARLSDVWLRDVRLLSADLASSTWMDGTFIACAGAGIQAYDSSFQRVVFSECKAAGCRLRPLPAAGHRFRRRVAEAGQVPGLHADPDRLLAGDAGSR